VEYKEEINDQIFSSFGDNRKDKSSSLQWRMILACVSVAALALVLWPMVTPWPPWSTYHHAYRNGPYHDMVRRLHPNMTIKQVEEELGYTRSGVVPAGGGEQGFQGHPGGYWLEYSSHGERLPLSIYFFYEEPGISEPDGVLDKWCVFLPDEGHAAEAGEQGFTAFCHEVR